MAGLALVCVLALVATCAADLPFVPVFTPGEGGYPCIRIPSILRVQHLQLAFAECRNRTGDGCLPKMFQHMDTRNLNRDICMKVSADMGKTWGPLRVIIRNALQPTPVYIINQDVIVLNYNRVSTAENFQVFSTDMGNTWGKEINISGMLTGGPYYVGPGIGIIKNNPPYKGRIMFIGHHGAYEYDRVWYSDDMGATYTVSDTVLPKMDEAQLAELPDGSIIASMRNDHINNTCPCQALSVSQDGGKTFSPIRFDPTLITPVCMAALFSDGGGNLYFAVPDSATNRTHGVIRRSTDGGLTWPYALTVTQTRSYAYSCIGDIFSDGIDRTLLWETSTDSSVCTGDSCQIVFSIFPARFT